MNQLNFTAIDFETAQGKRWSICQVGIVVVEQGIIKDTISFLVQPPDNVYQQGNIRVHGITPEHTKTVPFFNERWDFLKPYIIDRMVVAHNFSFDYDCLMQTLGYYELDIPFCHGKCTYEMTGLSLENACKVYDISIKNHHDALHDALAAAELYIKLHAGFIPKLEIENTPKDKFGHGKISGEFLKIKQDVENTSNPFFHKKVVVTGLFNNYSRDEIKQILFDLGADINGSISKKTEYVIKGFDAGPAKLAKIDELINSGCKIIVLEEEEFEKMIQK